MTGKQTLKLNFGKSAGENAPEQPTGNAQRKIKFKIGQQGASSDATATNQTSTPKQAKKKAPPKEGSAKTKTDPSKKKSTTKRDAAAAGQEPGEALPPVKRIKFSTKEKPQKTQKTQKPQKPQVKFNVKGKPRERPRGCGYDSEASDTEMDPALEEEFILRMQPGEDCDYLRQAIAEKRFGPRIQGGADVSFKPLTRDGRRATVTIQGHMYAASLVDLPCIVEGMKSWDKRGWYKSADICQMLLVLGRVNSEDEALNYPLPKDVDPSTFQYAHGLTPPMRRVRKRRFRNRISNRTIEAVELEVARLLRQDENAVKPPHFEVMDYADYAREQRGEEEEEEEEEADYEMYDEDQDAEGEVDEQYYGGEPATQEGEDDMFEDELAAEMEAALAAHAEASSVPVSAGAEGGQTVPEADADAEGEAAGKVKAEAELEEAEGEAESEVLEAGTPQTKHTTGGETSGDEEDESEESSPEADGAELDDDALEQQQQLQERREEVAELENLLQTETARWQQMTNPILKSKLGRTVQNLKQELNLKKLSIGESEE